MRRGRRGRRTHGLGDPRPRALAYASIVGVSPVVGLYAAPAALALSVGVAVLVAGLLRLGFLANFISEPELKGFIVGLALTIMIRRYPSCSASRAAPATWSRRRGTPLRTRRDRRPHAGDLSRLAGVGARAQVEGSASAGLAGRRLPRHSPSAAGLSEIETSVELRAATEADLAWARDLARHEAVAASLSTTAADGLADAVAAGELWIAKTPGGERVGVVRVTTVNRRSRIASIETLIVHPDVRGRHLGVAVLRAFARAAFARGVHRLEGEVYGFNEPALRTFDAAGFTREGGASGRV
jgi:ribosomal protein S18 acetylase RimI-like enzyme